MIVFRLQIFEMVCLYQLRYVVDDDQVGPGVSEAEVGFVINAAELTDPDDTGGTTIK